MLDLDGPIRFEPPIFLILCLARKAVHTVQMYFPSPSHPAHQKNMAGPQDYVKCCCFAQKPLRKNTQFELAQPIKEEVVEEEEEEEEE